MSPGGGDDLIEVRVSAHSKQVKVRLDGDLLRVSVVEAAERGKANRAVEAAIADALGLRRREVRIVSGATSKRKFVSIEGMDPAQIRSSLLD